jgi:hypothetical protein
MSTVLISGGEAVESYIAENLTKIATNQSGWDTLYINKATEQYWVLTYPNSQLHGGGHPELTRVSKLVVKKEFGV